MFKRIRSSELKFLSQGRGWGPSINYVTLEGVWGVGQSVTNNDRGMGKSVTRGWGVLKMAEICVTYFMNGPIVDVCH